MGTMREDLEAAYEIVGEPEDDKTLLTQVATPDKVPGPEEILAAKPEKTPDGELPTKTQGSEDKNAGDGVPDAPLVKAPAGWTPEAKVAWESLPDIAKKQIIQREKDFTTGIQRNNDSARYGQTIKQVLAPFQAVMQMEGADDVTAIHSLASTAAQLRMGTPREKAGIVAELIKAYGVSVQELDDVLSGETTGVSPEDQRLQQMLDSRLAPITQALSGFEAARNQSAQSTMGRVDAEIAEFEAKAEFLDDVREEMADFLEMSAKRGRDMTMQQAYDLAVSARPDLAKITAERGRVAVLKQGQNRVAAKRAAASSVAGSATGTQGAAKKTHSMREDLEAAFEAVANRG